MGPREAWCCRVFYPGARLLIRFAHTSTQTLRAFQSHLRSGSISSRDTLLWLREVIVVSCQSPAAAERYHVPNQPDTDGTEHWDSVGPSSSRSLTGKALRAMASAAQRPQRREFRTCMRTSLGALRGSEQSTGIPQHQRNKVRLCRPRPDHGNPIHKSQTITIDSSPSPSMCLPADRIIVPCPGPVTVSFPSSSPSRVNLQPSCAAPAHHPIRSAAAGGRWGSGAP
jgi:hypothetical protein